jgi:hypothetical protein
MYVKKSSIRSSRVLIGHIDSALRTACEEKDANVAATLLGDVGEEKPPPDGDSSLTLFALISSACLFGGPLRRLGLWKVQGMSRAAQALHGGPVSSHCGKVNVRGMGSEGARSCSPLLFLYYRNHMLCANDFLSAIPLHSLGRGRAAARAVHGRLQDHCHRTALTAADGEIQERNCKAG